MSLISQTLHVKDCGGPSNTPYTFTGKLYPGTYQVQVDGENYSALPTWTTVVAERILIP